MIRLGIFATHPVQYHVPLWRGLSNDSGITAKVFYFSDQGVAQRVDPDFGQVVQWDVPLLDGYESEFLQKNKIDCKEGFAIPKIASFLDEQKFDAVLLPGYAHEFERQLIRWRKRGGYKVVLRGEFTDVPPLGRRWPKAVLREFYLRWFYSHVDHFCSIGTESTMHLQRRGVPSGRITLTPYSVDTAIIDNQRKQTSREEARASLGLLPGQLLFLFSGKLIERKQPLLLAKAAAALAGNPNFALCLLGSGEQFDAVKSALEPALHERLIMPGFVNQSMLGNYFAAADVFVLPSAYDTWGLVVNEAMHWGLPCIVSNRTGCYRDLVHDGVTGFVHEWNDPKALAVAMNQFLDDPGLATRLGANALKRIDDFRLEKTIQGLRSAVYQSLQDGT